LGREEDTLSEIDKQFKGSIPEIYDTHLVPLIFEQYATDLAQRTSLLAPDALLEIASGSGVVARAVAPILQSGTRHVVSDLNPPMLDRAAATQPRPDLIEWLPADALDLPLEGDSFDLVLCQFGCMFFPDRIRSYTEARRVLRPGGAFVFNMWDGIEENDFANVVTNALAERYPSDPPQFLARTPHGHYDTAVYRTELEAAGFTDIEIEPLDAISTATSPLIPAVAYCHGTPLRNEIEALDTYGLDEATEHAALAIASYFGGGEVSGRIRAFIVTAR
jgi:ubiquinone/menaquinone biosynthesis C-methylase UbiE